MSTQLDLFEEDYIEIKNQILYLKDKISRFCNPLNLEIDKLNKTLLEVCPHPEGKVEVREEHYGGSYYERATTTTWSRCTICGTILEKIVKTHNYYG